MELEIVKAEEKAKKIFNLIAVLKKICKDTKDTMVLSQIAVLTDCLYKESFDLTCIFEDC